MRHLLNKRKHCYVPRALNFASIFPVCAAPLANVVVHQVIFVIMDGVVITATLLQHAAMVHAMTAPNYYLAAGVLPLEHASQQTVQDH